MNKNSRQQVSTYGGLFLFPRLRSEIEEGGVGGRERLGGGGGGPTLLPLRDGGPDLLSGGPRLPKGPGAGGPGGGGRGRLEMLLVGDDTSLD